MNTKESILDELDKIVFSKLKNEFSFMYDHIVSESRAALEERSKGIIEDEITDSVNANLHIENFDGHQSSVSSSVSSDEVIEFTEDHNRRMELIAAIYDKQKPATQD